MSSWSAGGWESSLETPQAAILASKKGIGKVLCHTDLSVPPVTFPEGTEKVSRSLVFLWLPL